MNVNSFEWNHKNESMFIWFFWVRVSICKDRHTLGL